MGKKLLGTDGTRWAFMKVFDIPDAIEPNKVDLRRWRLIQTPRFALYLHKINLPDRDRPMHDHPFNFWSFILKGGYSERLAITREVEQFTDPTIEYRRWPPMSFHKMPVGMCHNIDVLHATPTWSLVFVGRRQQDWGFILPGQGWVQHDAYFARLAGL